MGSEGWPGLAAVVYPPEAANPRTLDQTYCTTAAQPGHPDGQANRGRIIDPAEILNEIRQLNAMQKVRIHSIGIGPGHDATLMRGLAEITGGTYVSK